MVQRPNKKAKPAPPSPAEEKDENSQIVPASASHDQVDPAGGDGNSQIVSASASHDQIAPVGEDHDENKQIDPAGEGQIVRWEAPRMSLAQLLDDAKANAIQGTAHDHTYEEPQQGAQYTCCMVTRSHVGDSALEEGWKQ